MLLLNKCRVFYLDFYFRLEALNTVYFLSGIKKNIIFRH